MSYSCSDFTDDILRVLRVPEPRGDEDVEDQADVAILKIIKMRRLLRESRDLLDKIFHWTGDDERSRAQLVRSIDEMIAAESALKEGKSNA